MMLKLRLKRCRLWAALLILLAVVAALVMLQRGGRQETVGPGAGTLTLVIDPGHGGIDSGAVGARSRTRRDRQRRCRRRRNA